MAGPGFKIVGIQLTSRLGGHDGDEDDISHEHCSCGWCLPADTVPVYPATLPKSPDGIVLDNFAIPGVSVVLVCPRCGESHVMSIGPKPQTSDAN